MVSLNGRKEASHLEKYLFTMKLVFLETVAIYFWKHRKYVLAIPTAFYTLDFLFSTKTFSTLYTFGLSSLMRALQFGLRMEHSFFSNFRNLWSAGALTELSHKYGLRPY